MPILKPVIFNNLKSQKCKHWVYNKIFFYDGFPNDPTLSVIVCNSLMLSKMVQNYSKLHEIAWNGPKWPKWTEICLIVRNGSKWSVRVWNGQKKN